MVNNSEFILKEIPKYNPVLEEYAYREFWSTEKRKCIEGTWVGGVWCPPTLYYHANFSVIPLESQGSSQAYGRSLMRDIDWEFYRYYEEARGFSGFTGDEQYSCHRVLTSDRSDQEIIKIFCTVIGTGEIHQKNYNNIFKPDGTRKEYIPAREYIARVQPKGNLGKPIYNNNSQNLSVFGARGAGKTIWASTCVLTNWLFGGAKDYDEYVAALIARQFQISTTIIGAYETKFTTTLRDYILNNKSFLNDMHGMQYAEREYFCPLWLEHFGSTQINHAEGLSTTHGSKLMSRAFSDQSTSANSTRPNLAVIDEVGFAKNIEDIMGSLEGSEASKVRKVLTILLLGTGGMSNGSSITHFERVFKNPEGNNCLAFDDIYENTGKIGWFIPITKANLAYKDPKNNYISDIAFGEKEELAERAKIKDARKMASRKVNNPLVPSEAFLVVDGTKFPSGLLKDQLGEVEGGKYKKYRDSSWKGWFVFNTQGGVEFETSQSVLPIRDYPLSKDNEHLKKGAVEIWVHPQTDASNKIPNRRYIGGVDVVHKDIAQTDSLPSMFIYDTWTDRIVCEYTGRTDRKSFFHDQVRKAAMYYNAVIMYEQSMTDIFTHFKQNQALRYLADTPKDLRNDTTWKEGADTSKGIPATSKVKEVGEGFILDWLLTPISSNSDELFLNTIYSSALLKELIRHDGELNTDRVSALIMVFWYRSTLRKTTKEEHQKKKDELSEYYMKRNLFRKRNQDLVSNSEDELIE